MAPILMEQLKVFNISEFPLIGPEALPEREHSVTLDLDMAISDKIITE